MWVYSYCIIVWIHTGLNNTSELEAHQLQRPLFSVWKEGILDNSHSLNTTNVLCYSKGDAGSSDFPPLAPIIASSIQDVSRSDRRCLITTSPPLHGRQIGSTRRICALSSFCRPHSLLSFDTARQIPPLSSTVALFVFSPSFFFFSFSRCDLWAAQVYLSDT